MENIDQIKRKAIVEIKEKVKKNPGYLHPCNKERQEDMKRLKFDSGNSFTFWMQQNGIMKNPTDIERKVYEKTAENAGCKNTKGYLDKCARDLGFKDNAERQREQSYNTGKSLPKEFREDCPVYFGDFTESLMIQTFEGAVRMRHNNPGFDWICKRGDKIDNKGRCLIYNNKSPNWIFNIRYNNIADWFILSAWDSRDSLTPLHVWAFHKDDIVGGKKFWRRDSFSITNTPKGLKEFEKYEITGRLDKLKELCNKKKDA